MRTLFRTFITIAFLVVGTAAVANVSMKGNTPGAFEGTYHGVYTWELQGGKKAFEVDVSLNKKGNQIIGEFEFDGGKGTISNGVIKGNTLIFTWTNGGMSGTGQLKALHNGQLLSGQWNGGYQTKGIANKGSWKLERE